MLFFFSRRNTTFGAEDDISGELRWSHSDRLLNAHLFCFLDLFMASVDNGEKAIYFFFVEIGFRQTDAQTDTRLPSNIG